MDGYVCVRAREEERKGAIGMPRSSAENRIYRTVAERHNGKEAGIGWDGMGCCYYTTLTLSYSRPRLGRSGLVRAHSKKPESRCNKKWWLGSKEHGISV